MSTTLVKNGIPTKMTDDEFYEFCAAHKDWRIERTSNLEVVIMAPTGSDSGKYALAIGGQLWQWTEQTGRGEVFGPSAGFTLPDRSVRSADACWIAIDRLNRLPAGDTRKFAHICPDFVIEVRSPSDVLAESKEKMEVWLNNGCKLAWLIDPTTLTSWTYRPAMRPEMVVGFERKLHGEPPVDGFVLDLSLLRVRS